MNAHHALRLPVATASFLLLSYAGNPQNASHFDGVHNFRDVGGYATIDGLTIRRGILYRSADLGDMTLTDRERLLSLGIGYEIDLRSPAEISKRPSNWGTEALHVSTPFDFDPSSPSNSKKDDKDIYAEIAIGQAENIGKGLRQLAGTDVPVLVHCAAGADRTGIFIAVLMRLLGVAEKQLVSEYLLSNEYWTSEMGRKDLRIRTGLSEDAIKAWPGLRDEQIVEVFRFIDLRYKSFDGYVRDGLRLTPQEVQRLRTRLLTEAKLPTQ